MKASRVVKAAAALAVLAALGVGAAFVAVKVYFPEPRARAWFVDAARKQLGRDVRLSRIDVGLRGLSLVGLEVSEKPDFSAGSFLKVADFRLRPSWRALIKRKLVVAAVSADGLQVQVIQGKDGHYNYETLTSSAAPAMAANPPKKADAEAPELDVRHASVTDGAVEYRSADGSVWALSGVSLDLTDFSQAEPFGLKTSFRVQGAPHGRPVDAQVSFDGRIELARGSHERFKATVKKLVVEEEGLTLAASGVENGLDAPDVSLDASLAASGKELLSVSGRAKIGPAASADLKWASRPLDTTLISRYFPEWGIPALDLPPAEGALVATYEPGAADVKAFSASWKGGQIQASGSARGLGGAKPVYDGRATFGVDLPARKPGEYPFLKLPPKLSTPAARLDGEVALKDGVLKIVSLKTKTAQGVVSVDGSVKGALTAKPAPDVTAALALDLPAFKVSDLPLAVSAVPGSFAVPAGRLDGTVRVSGDDVSFKGVTFKAHGASIGVDGTVAKALAGAPVPDVAVTADLTLPALTDKDLPFAGAPPGLKMPPSHWTTALDYSPRLVKLKSLRVQTGKNDLEASGSVTDPSGRAAFDLLFKCRSFVLEELTQLTPRTRDLKLAGSGYFALSITGTKDKPVFGGKLQFKGLGATVADLPLADFTGTASFDPDRIDIPNLRGKFADGRLEMDLTVRDYAKSPMIDLEASLDRFDLGKYLDAKAEIAKEQAAADAARQAKAGKAAAPEKPTPFATRGRLKVGTVGHPHGTVEDVTLAWDLRGITPDLRGLNGDAKFHVGAGRIYKLGDMVLPKSIKIMLAPVFIVQKIRGADLNDIAINQIVGDYAIKDGLLTLRQSGLDSDALHATQTGTIDLPDELLNLTVTTQYGNVIPIETAVTGTFDRPKTKVKVAKAIGQFLQQTIQGGR